MGRMVTFMARILKDSAKPPVSSARAVGVDEHTALLLDVKTGDVTAVGVGTAYVCAADHNAQVCKDKSYLTFQGTFYFIYALSIVSIIITVVIAPFVNLCPGLWFCAVLCCAVLCCRADVQCTRLSGKNGDKYSFATFSGQGVDYVNNVISGVFTGNPYGPL